ncbi:DUF5134 domain-containing protein [Streptomyces sp. WMMC940]|uniref:DUF5134 domain-containing protein n=1 Tax=Streptomyces sp. WMMC940 TaxID=3015153 RepID=UPI0022B68157|nr:DUF5134 domain-containing protein [Streptomyces sp. WMMC940]MCZ7461710.1 DUF5134 domain-containing protein [Streptomyces sp. WMMC940]
MHGPAMPGWLLVALCAVSGAYCLVRMRCCAGPARSAATDEALMGFGMASMAVPAAVAPAPAWRWLLFAALFGAVGLRALWATRVSRAGAHHLHHLVGSLAMVYMAVAMSPFAAGGHGEHGGPPGAGGVPLVTGALLVYFTVFVLRTGARLVPVAAPAGGPPPAWGARPELALACRVSMGVAMVAMLLTV